jgi:choline dehydrogenase-like flavoprotein
MRCYDDNDEVDFAIVGTGAGGGTLACKLAESGFSVVAFDAGPFWRPLDDFASDERYQSGLFWTDERITGGADPVELGSNNSGRGVGGSTVHYTMIALRWRPEWFKCKSTLGYGRDWPISFEELEPYYEEAEEALKIAGPLKYPWGRRRRRYPYREHPVNSAGLVLARGCEAIGVKWSPLPLATLSAPRGMAHPCVYRGFCAYGCSTNAKQSVLVTFIPRALKAGAEVRDLAMVGRIEMGKDGKASGLLYHRQGKWRRQKARHVVVAGYAIETVAQFRMPRISRRALQ